MANPPTEGIIPVDNVQKFLQGCMIRAGIVGLDESIEATQLNDAFTQLNWILAEWAASRWLTYSLSEYSIVSTGANSYNVGNKMDININPRPDRLEYAFLRFLNSGQPAQFPVDIQLKILQSKEDYSRITVKTIGTIPRQVFYDPQWPVGVILPWPVPQPSIYELHFGFKTVLPRFSNLQDPINFPPEYESALNWTLARRLRESYQLPPSPTVNSLARNSLNALRKRNAAMGTLQMPSYLRPRQVAYDYRSDNADD